MHEFLLSMQENGQYETEVFSTTYAYAQALTLTE